MAAGGKIQSLERALKIVGLFSEDKPEWGITEISNALGLHKSTVHRLVSTLEEQGFLRQDPATSRYSLGLRLIVLGNVAISSLDIRKMALPWMEKLRSEVGETVHLGVLDDGEVISIEGAETRQALRPVFHIGKRAPLHCTAVGKAIMAFLPDEEIDRIIRVRGLKKFTERTITEVDVLKASLAEIRRLGFSVDDIEHEEGIRCVGAPIRDYDGTVVASLSISGPSVRIRVERIPELSRVVKDVAAKISAQLGYRERANNPEPTVTQR